ncbi:MAG TPA: hypothetical protein VHC46_01470, partial [Thermodesulfobacteriota bacterium]|nr:hypothetical protein [Thermodesulfobacteriota bacterium]
MRSKFYTTLMLAALIGIMGAVSCRRADENETPKTEPGKPAPAQKASPAKPAAQQATAPTGTDTDVDKILAKYFDAIGGRAKWNDVKTLKYTGKMHSMGKLFQMAIVYKRP